MLWIPNSKPSKQVETADTIIGHLLHIFNDIFIGNMLETLGSKTLNASATIETLESAMKIYENQMCCNVSHPGLAVVCQQGLICHAVGT